MAQVKALIETSYSCYQEIKFNCKMATLDQASWIDVNGDDQDIPKCECSKPRNSCHHSMEENFCNCNARPFVQDWQEDVAKVTNRALLPIKGFKYGYMRGQANVTIGELFCKGGENPIKATASSVYGDSTATLGPQFAVDGLFSTTYEGPFYHSAISQHPWLKIEFDQAVTLTGIRLYNRQDCCGDRLNNIMVRAGSSRIPDDYSGIITQNTLCGNFTGPGENAGVYVVTCKYPIIADVITIQIVKSGNQILQLDEVEFITEDEGHASSCQDRKVECTHADCRLDNAKLDCRQTCNIC
jgi:hypothetical protein